MEHWTTWERLSAVFTAGYAGHFIRYVLMAGGVFVLFYVWRHRRLRALKIQPAYPGGGEMRREIGFSLLSMAVFALVGVGVFLMYRAGWTKLHLDIGRHGWGWLAFSTVLLIFAHDAYFYWTHRLMHWKPLFPLVHRVHHLSHTPTPWAAFAFHPIEAVIQAAVFPLFILVVPAHPLTALVWLFYMTGMNVLGHCGFEILPRGFTRHPVSRWHNTTVHHDMHHRHVHCNYGLYYNLWDRLMGTNHPRYEEEFERVKGRAARDGLRLGHIAEVPASGPAWPRENPVQ
jgi:sterol desaturase/sphingolipid hydroxylase (fatty acid hydroxylase superfamily)